MMKIVAGVSCIDDYIRLVKAGADEVFIGYVPYEYTKKYGNLFPINRREVLYFNAQIKSLSDMKILKKMVDVYKVPVSITFNNTYYLEEQYEYVGEIMKELINIGFERFIVADIGLILYLNQNNIHCSVHLSGECAETNRLSIDFFNKLDIKRYIFNRKTTIDEMKSCIDYGKFSINKTRSMIGKKHEFDYEIKKIIDESKSFVCATDNIKNKNLGLEYEAFVLNERCHYTGAFCSSFHCDEMIHLCEMPYQMGKIDELSFDFPSVDEKFEKYYENNIHRHKEKIKAQDEDLYKLGSTGCGLCSLKRLQMVGITHLKVVGRGNFIENIEQDVRSVKNALQFLDKTDDPCKYGWLIKENLFNEKCSENCYYIINK